MVISWILIDLLVEEMLKDLQQEVNRRVSYCGHPEKKKLRGKYFSFDVFNAYKKQQVDGEGDKHEHWNLLSDWKIWPSHPKQYTKAKDYECQYIDKSHNLKSQAGLGLIGEKEKCSAM